MAVLLTDRLVARMPPQATQVDFWDRKVTGLGLRVSPSGKKTWTLRYRVGRRLRRWTIGTYPAVSLKDARLQGQRGVRNVELGGPDPATAKQARRHADTVEVLGKEYIERHAKPRKRTWKDDDRLLRKELYPQWRHVAITDIRRRDVRNLVDAIAQRGTPILANRVLALVGKLFAFAVDREYVDTNPAAQVARPGVERQRDRVLTDDEIRQFWTSLDREAPAMAAVFRLRLLTAQRGGEVLHMRWCDLDLENGWWTVPTERSKNKLPHRVPLTNPALDMLRALGGKAGGYVLVGARGMRPRTQAAKRFSLSDFRPHDLRRTAASRMASAGVSRLVISKVLNHVERGVTAVYDRHSYDAEKRVALETWARELDAILTKRSDGRVVPFVSSRG